MTPSFCHSLVKQLDELLFVTFWKESQEDSLICLKYLYLSFQILFQIFKGNEI